MERATGGNRSKRESAKLLNKQKEGATGGNCWVWVWSVWSIWRLVCYRHYSKYRMARGKQEARGNSGNGRLKLRNSFQTAGGALQHGCWSFHRAFGPLIVKYSASLVVRRGKARTWSGVPACTSCGSARRFVRGKSLRDPKILIGKQPCKMGAQPRCNLRQGFKGFTT